MLDGYNSGSGRGGGDPASICIESEAEKAIFDDYIKKAKSHVSSLFFLLLLIDLLEF